MKPDLPEQERVLNVLGMFERGEMHTEGKPMRVLPLMCKTVLSIRKLNRLLLDKIKNRSWLRFDVRHPEDGDEILVRFDDASGIHVELMEWTEDDEEFFHLVDDNEQVWWMKLPPISEEGINA